MYTSNAYDYMKLSLVNQLCRGNQENNFLVTLHFVNYGYSQTIKIGSGKVSMSKIRFFLSLCSIKLHKYSSCVDRIK